MHYKRMFSTAGLVGVAIIVCASATAASDPAGLPPESYGTWGFDLSGRDTAVRPGDDFFSYANGTYLERTKIPPDRTWYGTLNMLRDLSEVRLHSIVETAAEHAALEPARQDLRGKVGAFYAAFINEPLVEALDSKPLAADLGRIRNAKDHSHLAALMARSKRGFLPSLFDIQIEPDLRNPDRYSVYVDQGGLGLPSRDYYLQSSFGPKKQAYQAYVAKMLGMLSWPDPESNSRAIVDFEARVAEASWTKAAERDPDRTYNPVGTAELAQIAPGFDWSGWLAGLGLSSRDQVIAGPKSALPKIAAIYSSTPLDVLKAYMAFHLADNAAYALSSRFVQATFDFRGRDLSGQEALPVRWKRAVRATSDALSEPVGRIYVGKYFPPESKARMVALVNNLRRAYQARIEALSWMSPRTKAKALEKLAAMDVQVGYPKHWKDYSSLLVRSNDLYGNDERALGWRWDSRLARIDLRVDRDEWDTSPQTVNAFNDPTANALLFPAAILQAPVFNPKADPAVNYGAIGAVIGHEMSHGFDDQGRKFDAHGRLTDWWTANDAQHFMTASKNLGAQYERFPVIEGGHINGELTMGENIADLAGVVAALDAYHASLGGKRAPVIDGFTGDQRFFLGYAQYYRNKWRPDFMRRLLVSNPHSPDRARVDVVLANVDDWYRAWDVKPSDKLYLGPQERVGIW